MDDAGPSLHPLPPLIAATATAGALGLWALLAPPLPTRGHLAPGPATPGTARAAGPGPGGPAEVHPIAFYAARCASCHGDYGELYGFLGQGIDNDYLTEVVPRMVKLHGRADLDPAAMSAQIAYARSLADGSAFITAPSAPDATGLRRGEVTPGATVVATRGDRQVVADVSGHTYTLLWPTPDGPERVEAELNGRVTSLPVDAAAGFRPHSHGAGGVQ